MTSRGPLTLAALASAAVPGLDPDTVEGVVSSGPGDTVDVAFVSDREHRRWVVRCPRTPAASAQIERSAALLALLVRRLTTPVPAVRGWVALPEGGRAAVHTYLTGRPVNLDGIAAGSALATGLGRLVAQLHNLDPRVYEEAGVPVYDAPSYRARRLAELDRAAATGRVPTGLLTRWEQVLDDESLWSFTTTPTHGEISGTTLLATPDDGDEPAVKALLGWESAQVADPADDLAPLVAALDPEALDTVLEAYAHARVERPDRHLQERARIVGEMQLVRTMMAAVAAGDDEGAEEHARELRRLDDRLAREEEAAAPSAGRTEDTQPVRTGTATGSSSSEATDPPGGARPAKDAEDSGAEDAVQVEHPATPTPVGRPAPDDPVDTLGGPDEETAPEETRETPDAADEEDGSANSTTPEATADEIDADEARTADPAPDEEPAEASGSAPESIPDARPKRGNDHITAEITPIADDDGDDVVPPGRPS